MLKKLEDMEMQLADSRLLLPVAFLVALVTTAILYAICYIVLMSEPVREGSERFYPTDFSGQIYELETLNGR